MAETPKAVRKGNETYEIEMTSPLIRPGFKLTTWVSKRYVAKTLSDMLDLVREFNEYQDSLHQEKPEAEPKP